MFARKAVKEKKASEATALWWPSAPGAGNAMEASAGTRVLQQGSDKSTSSAVSFLGRQPRIRVLNERNVKVASCYSARGKAIAGQPMPKALFLAHRTSWRYSASKPLNIQ